jgi:hypothetical protein
VRPTQPPIQLVPGLSRGLSRPGRGVDHPPPFGTEIKDKVELYLYSTSRPSWPVFGRPLPLPSLQVPHLNVATFSQELRFVVLALLGCGAVGHWSLVQRVGPITTGLLEDGTETLSRSVGDQIRTQAAPHPQTSATFNWAALETWNLNHAYIGRAQLTTGEGQFVVKLSKNGS